MVESPDGDDRTSGTVQSVMRALDVLEAVAQGGPSSSLTSICGQTGLPGPTAFRLLNTLAIRGYVIKTARREYSIGPSFIAYNSIAGESLGSLSDALLADLVERTAEAASLVMRDRYSGIVMAHRAPSSGGLFAGVGNGLPLHATAAGKCLLASLEARKLTHYLKSAKLTRFTEHTITSASVLRSEIEQARRAGFALEREEYERGVCGAAIGVPGVRGFALCVSGPPLRFTDEFCHAVALPALRDTARILGSELETHFPRPGWRPHAPVEAQAKGIGL